MLASAALLSIPLALTAGAASHSTVPSPHHDVRAYVTGYNTVAGQTDSTPCLAASGANICGRRDAVACPRQISLGTVVEIRGTTYVCEDRLAKKFDHRFDISCDKDTKCPPSVTGWTTITVYENPRTEAAAVPPAAAKTAQNGLLHHAVARVKSVAHAVPKLLANAGNTVLVLRGRA